MATVVMNGRELRDYWAVAKAERKRMALYYQENPQATIKMVMVKFHKARHTVNKALAENGIAVDRSRNPAYSDRGCKQHRCLDCGETYRHYCQPDAMPTANAEGQSTNQSTNGKLSREDIEDARRIVAEMSRPPRQ